LIYNGFLAKSQISMNCVRFMLPSPAFAPLGAGLVDVAM
jgi:hypothetical protein